MGNDRGVKLCLLGLLTCARVAFASADEAADSSGAFGGVMLVLGFVFVAYAFVFVVKLLMGSKDPGPDRVSATELDDFARQTDDPSFRFPDSWPGRRSRS